VVSFLTLVGVLVGVSHFVPVHQALVVGVILLEANKFLLKDDTASVDYVVSRNILDVLASLPHVPSINFVHILVRAPD